MRTNLIARSAIAIREQVESFEAAIGISAQLLVSSNYASEKYVERVLENYRSLGAYFVVAPGIAIAHASAGADVQSPGLSLLKLNEGVISGVVENDPVKLVFSLCTPDRDQHIELMGDFAQLMSDSEIVNSLLNASAESVIEKILTN